jgi:hypothetical protein
MDDDVRAFGTELGRKALARDWAGVHAMLAPWMRARWPADRVQRFFEDEYRAALEANGAEGVHTLSTRSPSSTVTASPRQLSFASQSRSRAGRCATFRWR